MRLARGPVILALSLLLAAPTPSLSWGKAGHPVVATIAATLLTAEAQA